MVLNYPRKSGYVFSEFVVVDGLSNVVVHFYIKGTIHVFTI